MNDPPEYESKSTLWRKIRALQLPERIKQKLRQAWMQCRALIQAVVNFLYAKRHFCSALILGVIIAYLLQGFPILGPIMADLSISLSVLAGLIQQLKADLLDAFGPQPTHVVMPA